MLKPADFTDLAIKKEAQAVADLISDHMENIAHASASSKEAALLARACAVLYRVSMVGEVTPDNLAARERRLRNKK